MFPLVVLACIGAVLLVLLAPGCGRTSLEPESLDSRPRASSCGPATCPDGCCDASGICRTGQDTRACGGFGGRCSDCVANGFEVCTSSRVCGRDDPSCGPSTCASGCCAISDGRLRCLSGTEPAACGSSGGTCSDCAADGRGCDVAARTCGTTRCDSTNCTGCCVGDKCLPGNTSSACGTKGLQCSSCAAGQVCQGLGGAGGVCEGTGSCGPQNCGGCCNAAGQCVTGTDTTACGKQGQKCDVCSINEICVKDGSPNARTCQPQTTCGPDNCAGCCVGNQCVSATTPQACGIKGLACKTCGKGQVCDPSGNCVSGSDCNPATCAGCCVGDICAVGTQQTACGSGGALCQNCANQSSSRVCQGGTCELPACGPSTCPKGCCLGNTCVSGTQDNACGITGGAACTDCSAQNQVCRGGLCRDGCGPANCAGCCRNDNSCDSLGISNNSCGQGGLACTNCTQSGSFCNGLVSPRRCNNQQSTCPAAYGTCAQGTTMPIALTLQKQCSDADLDTLAVPCAGGPDTATCIAAFALLPAACQQCLTPFNHPFEQKAGLYACAAGALTNQCRRAMGCAIDCAQKSCNQCVPTSENQCYTLVNGNGQCSAYANAANCASPVLAGGLCSQFSYANYGAWLRGVGDQFCGNGP